MKTPARIGPALLVSAICTLGCAAPPPATSSSTTPPSGAARPEPRRICGKASTQIAWCEDFFDLAEGSLPPDWIGGDGLMVKVSGGRKVLAPFEPRAEYLVTMPSWKATGDFRIDWVLRTARGYPEDLSGMTMENTDPVFYTIRAGTLEMTLQTSWGGGWESTIKLNDSSETLSDLANTNVQLGLAREGNVVKVFVNSKQVLLARYDDVSTIDGISLVASNAGKEFEIQAIAMAAAQ